MNGKLNLEIACWNVNGLISKEGNRSVSKLSKKDFTDDLKKYDIVCLLETKVGPNVNLVFDRNYIELITCSLGGLVLYVKSVLRDGITFIPPTSSEYIWIKLKKEVFNTVEDIFVCFAYVNPEGSSYTSDIDILQQIQHDIATFKSNVKCSIDGRSKWPHKYSR